MFPALVLLAQLMTDRAQLFVLFLHVFVLHEIPLMETVEVAQEYLHLPGFIGQNQPTLLLCHGETLDKLAEGAGCNWIALNIPQRKRHNSPHFRVHLSWTLIVAATRPISGARSWC